MNEQITDTVIRRVGGDMRDEDAETRSEAARVMGQARSEKKAVAVRENGKLGGRPKNIPASDSVKKSVSEAQKLRWRRWREQKAADGA